MHPGMAENDGVSAAVVRTPVDQTDGEGQTSAAAHAVFPGAGEMAARCRAFDWAATPLGPRRALAREPAHGREPGRGGPDRDDSAVGLRARAGLQRRVRGDHGRQAPGGARAAEPRLLARGVGLHRADLCGGAGTRGDVHVRRPAARARARRRARGDVLHPDVQPGVAGDAAADACIAHGGRARPERRRHPRDRRRDHGARPGAERTRGCIGGRERAVGGSGARAGAHEPAAPGAGGRARDAGRRAAGHRGGAGSAGRSRRACGPPPWRRASGQFHTLADTIPTLAWTAGADGAIDWYNAQWYAYTGTTPEAMAGWGWQSVHDPVVLPDVLARWQASIATGAPVRDDVPAPRRGRRLPALSHAGRPGPGVRRRDHAVVRHQHRHHGRARRRGRAGRERGPIPRGSKTRVRTDSNSRKRSGTPTAAWSTFATGTSTRQG